MPGTAGPPHAAQPATNWLASDQAQCRRGDVVEKLDNGVTVYQASDAGYMQCNIYCEFPWCPPDGSLFVYFRYHEGRKPNPHEYMTCSFDTWQTRTLGNGCGGCMMAAGRFWFRQRGDDGAYQLVSVDLITGQEEIHAYPEAVPQRASIAIDPSGQRLAFHQRLSLEPLAFSISVADLQTGEARTLHSDGDTCNPHLQFDPSGSGMLMVQHNRGCRLGPDGKIERLVGPEGCTLYTIDTGSGQLTRLKIGPPYTASASGHEAWIGSSGSIIATLNVEDDYDQGKGPIVRLCPGKEAEEICAPWQMNHIGVEPSGQVFCADSCSPDAVLLGSPWNEALTCVCPARSSYRRDTLDTHPHAYVTPGLKWVVFNSDRAGDHRIYAARIPDGLCPGSAD